MHILHNRTSKYWVSRMDRRKERQRTDTNLSRCTDFFKWEALRDLILASRYVPLRIASSISCIFFKLSSPSACQHTHTHEMHFNWNIIHRNVIFKLSWFRVFYKRTNWGDCLSKSFNRDYLNTILFLFHLYGELVLGFRSASLVLCIQARVSYLLTNRVRVASTLSKQTSQNEHAEHRG